jgi:hypothetical protein
MALNSGVAIVLRLDARGKRVLIISDLHLPWSVKYWFEFLTSIYLLMMYDIIISIGDEVDNAAYSFHEKEPGMPGASKELEMACDSMKLLSTLFPKMYILDSNHGSLFYRRAKFAGLPYNLIKPLPEIYGTPLYEWHNEIILDTNNGPVYLCHGKKSGYGALAREMGASCIQGHFHTKAEITYHKTALGTRFNMFVGCLADSEKLAFQYAKNNVPTFINSVGEIDENGKPNLIFYNEADYEKNDA